MPMQLDGSCRCGGVTFRLHSHTPVPYQRCYCSICRKAGGSGGYGINIGGIADSLEVAGREMTSRFHATIDRDGAGHMSSAERHFCTRCGSALWLYDPTWPDLVHPYATAIDTALPMAPAITHIFLLDRPAWVPLMTGPQDLMFETYPDQSLEDWHKTHGLWVA